MKKMARTNYWNPSVNYIGKNSAQNFMNPKKVNKKEFLASGPCTGCSSECSPCDVGGSECGPCSSFG